MLVCNKCHKEKDETEFSFKNKAKGIRLHHCKACHSAYIKEHYARNKSAYVERAKQNSTKQRRVLLAFIQTLKTKCAHCGEAHPATLDFHHIDPAEKEITVSQATSKKQVLVEIQKCIVLCSNCHRKLHWNKRMGE